MLDQRFIRKKDECGVVRMRLLCVQPRHAVAPYHLADPTPLFQENMFDVQGNGDASCFCNFQKKISSFSFNSEEMRDDRLCCAHVRRLCESTVRRRARVLDMQKFLTIHELFFYTICSFFVRWLEHITSSCSNVVASSYRVLLEQFVQSLP